MVSEVHLSYSHISCVLQISREHKWNAITKRPSEQSADARALRQTAVHGRERPRMHDQILLQKKTGRAGLLSQMRNGNFIAMARSSCRA